MVKQIKVIAVLVLLHINSIAQRIVVADEHSLQFLNGKLAVKKGSYWGYVDINGKTLLDFVIPETLSASEKFPQPFTNTFIKYDTKLEKFGLIDGNNVNKTKFVYSKIIGFSENIGTATKSLIYKQGNQKIETRQAVYLNESGKELFKLPPQVYTQNGNLLTWDYFEEFGLFSEELAYVPAINLSQPGEAIYGYINNIGSIVIKPSFVNAGNFSEGIAVVSRYNNYNELKWGAIDKAGKTVVEFIYSSRPTDFKNGLSRVKTSDGKYGFINKNGKLIINTKYNWATEFYNGFALIGTNANDVASKSILINKNDFHIMDVSKYYFISILFPENPSIGDGLIKCKNDKNLYGAINLAGFLKIPFEFIRMENFSENRAYAETESKKGFIDTNGNWVFEIKAEKF